MQEFIDAIKRALVAHTGLAAERIKIEQPRDPELGDFAFPCFPLAKELKQAPPKIAAELAPKVAADLQAITVEATGPYLNFRVERGALARSILQAVETQGAHYGHSDEGHGRTIVLDLSSPNIAKPMHVGHLRSTIIGASVQRIHDALGYKTVGINHIGDWGAQFGKLVAAIQRWGDDVDLENDPIQGLFTLYVRFHEEEKGDPTLTEEGRAAFRELESGVDGKVRRIWRHVTEVSLREFQKVYDRLHVTFDFIRGEAYYESFLVPTIERIEKAGVTEVSEGALIVDLSEIKKNMAPCLLRKTDGTTLYATRDLAALFHRWEEFAFHRALYVVGSDQRLHFRQLKGVLRRMGLDWEERVEHVDFGLLSLPEGKLSTRRGQVVFLDDLLDTAATKAREVILEKNPDLAGLEQVAEAVGVGAVIFHDLKRERVKDVVFEWDEVLSFEGETGPYVQYTHARLASILRKAEAAGEGTAEPDYSLLAEAGAPLLALGRYPAVLRSAAERAEPCELAQYLLELCRSLNSWYVQHRVLGQAPALGAARLSLARGAKIVIGNGLRLLGMGAPEEM